MRKTAVLLLLVGMSAGARALAWEAPLSGPGFFSQVLPLYRDGLIVELTCEMVWEDPDMYRATGSLTLSYQDAGGQPAVLTMDPSFVVLGDEPPFCDELERYRKNAVPVSIAVDSYGGETWIELLLAEGTGRVWGQWWNLNLERHADAQVRDVQCQPPKAGPGGTQIFAGSFRLAGGPPEPYRFSSEASNGAVPGFCQSLQAAEKHQIPIELLFEPYKERVITGYIHGGRFEEHPDFPKR
jgi:hypothetical protein